MVACHASVESAHPPRSHHEDERRQLPPHAKPPKSMGSIQCISDFHPQGLRELRYPRFTRHAMLEHETIKEFHRDKSLAIFFPDVIDRADIWMIQSRSGLRFALEACCEYEDLALITTTPDAIGANVEFLDVAQDWEDPSEGDTVHCFGFPRSNGFLADVKSSGGTTQNTIALIPHVFSSEVLPTPSADELKFRVTEFHEDRHFLVNCEPAKEGHHMLEGPAVGNPHGGACGRRSLKAWWT